MRTQDVETGQEPHSDAPIPRDGSPKKVYHPPALVDWGSLLELTGGPLADIQDEGFTGSGGD